MSTKDYAAACGYAITSFSMDPLTVHGLGRRYGVVRFTGPNRGAVLLDVLAPKRDAHRFVKLVTKEILWSVVFIAGDLDHVILEFMGPVAKLRALEDLAKKRRYRLVSEYDRSQAPAAARLLQPPGGESSLAATGI